MSDTSSSDGGKNRRKDKIRAHVSTVIKKAEHKVRNTSTTKVKVWKQRRQEQTAHVVSIILTALMKHAKLIF
jgi:hypothetical protein